MLLDDVAYVHVAPCCNGNTCPFVSPRYLRVAYGTKCLCSTELVEVTCCNSAASGCTCSVRTRDARTIESFSCHVTTYKRSMHTHWMTAGVKRPIAHRTKCQERTTIQRNTRARLFVFLCYRTYCRQRFKRDRSIDRSVARPCKITNGLPR